MILSKTRNLLATRGAPQRVTTGFPYVTPRITTEHAVYQPTRLVEPKEPFLVFLTIVSIFLTFKQIVPSFSPSFINYLFFST